MSSARVKTMSSLPFFVLHWRPARVKSMSSLPFFVLHWRLMQRTSQYLGFYCHHWVHSSCQVKKGGASIHVTNINYLITCFPWRFSLRGSYGKEQSSYLHHWCLHTQDGSCGLFQRYGSAVCCKRRTSSFERMRRTSSSFH